jgi:hypothetical protein
MKKDIKRGINDLLNNFELSESQLAEFSKLEKECIGHKTKKHKLLKPQVWMSLVASFLVVGLFLGNVLNSQLSEEQQIFEIAAEVSYNHLNLKPLEVAHNQLATVTGYFKRLDFNPLASSRVTNLQTSLIGGRYCSIKGNVAAQLRMKDKQGRISTLFESRYNSEDFKMLPNIENGKAPKVLYVDGQKVSLWIEKGLVMALVSSAL